MTAGILPDLQARAAAALHGVGGDAPFGLVDFPDHRNVGDSAIWLGTTTYFRRHRGAAPSYVASLGTFSEAALRAALPRGPIFIHGGGNFGDLWPHHQEFRERLMERFPDREIVQLPQSIHYRDTGGLAHTARAIARHGRFRLFVRDLPSYELASARFECDVSLCPDMAFFLGPLERVRAPEVDVFCLMRSDRERVPGAIAALPGYSFRVADWLTESRLSVRRQELLAIAREVGAGRLDRITLRTARYEAAARARVARGCRLLSSGQAVITDRLHAHILCLLLGIPHAILDNSYGKLGHFLDAWTRGAPGVHPASSAADAERWAASVVKEARSFGRSARSG